MWNTFKKKESVVIPKNIYEMTARPVETPVRLLTPQSVLLKKLKWVKHKGRVGIVWELDSSGYATIHLVDAQGQTIGVDRVNATELHLANFMDIPEPRRTGISQVYAATLGYF